jgi:hypothetical protein
MKRRPTPTPPTKCCPTCGHPIIDDGLNLTRIQKRIFEVIKRHGRADAEILRTAIWGSDPNGGPEGNVLAQHIHLLNKRIRDQGIAIRKRGYGSPYRIVQIAEAAE